MPKPVKRREPDWWYDERTLPRLDQTLDEMREEGNGLAYLRMAVMQLDYLMCYEGLDQTYQGQQIRRALKHLDRERHRYHSRLLIKKAKAAYVRTYEKP